MSDRDDRLRGIALGWAVKSHGESPGEDKDRCFTARAEHFEKYLRGELESEPTRDSERPT